MIIILCLSHGIGIKVRLGEWDASSNNELYPYQEYGIFKIDIHPDFDSSNLRNDIAIITLSEPIDFNLFPHISPICLPQLYSGQSEHRYLFLVIFIYFNYFLLF